MTQPPQPDSATVLQPPGNPHGAVPRGLLNTPRRRSYDGRFGRMFPQLAEQPAHDPTNPADDAELRTIADSMAQSPGTAVDNRNIPSGYVYLGQFVDHDLTFDPTSQLQRRNDPEGLINFRTPRFDLDSVYGAGPDAAPFLYDQQPSSPQSGFRFLLQDTFDMPRNAQGRALIGDPRNDENGIVSQLHVAFLRFHNALMDQAAVGNSGLSPHEQFNDVQRLVQWHYQWVVVHDFLRRTVGEETLSTLLQVGEHNGEEFEFLRLKHYRHKVNPFLPVEFSVAAYRFGHSQVRDRYNINSQFERELFSPTGDDFRGFQQLRPGWQAAWSFFFDFDGSPQFSEPIDTRLSQSLIQLQGVGGDDANLALRNLRRGAALGLPSGQVVAAALGIEPLTDEQLAPAAPGCAPLWHYVLREAELLNAGQHLGPVGGLIVAETLLGLLRADPQSYLNQEPTWVPTLPTRSGDDQRGFGMTDLLAIAVPDQIAR